MPHADQTYRERQPTRWLRDHLTCVWVQQVAPGAPPYENRTSPNGGVELVCELGLSPRVIGPQTGPTAELLAPGATVVGLRFRPGAAPAALGMPASELVDLDVPAAELWGDAAATRIAETLAGLRTPELAAAALERAVLAAVRRGEALDPLVSEAVSRLHPGGASEVGELSASLYISERQLRRRCLGATGLGPKVLQRMLRFQGFLARAHVSGMGRADVAALAAQAGYADQPHLTRESIRLSGRAPHALLVETEASCVGRHDHSPSYAPLLRSERGRGLARAGAILSA